MSEDEDRELRVKWSRLIQESILGLSICGGIIGLSLMLGSLVLGRYADPTRIFIYGFGVIGGIVWLVVLIWFLVDAFVKRYVEVKKRSSVKNVWDSDY